MLSVLWLLTRDRGNERFVTGWPKGKAGAGMDLLGPTLLPTPNSVLRVAGGCTGHPEDVSI